MTKSAPTDQRGRQAMNPQSAGSFPQKVIQKSVHPAGPSGGQHKHKKRKVFFNTVDQLLKKKAQYEQKLAELQGPKMKRKRMNTLKVIMQINRAINHKDECIKDPDELAQKRHNDRLRRIAKKLEKKKMRQIVQNVREEEKYGVSHTSIQSRK